MHDTFTYLTLSWRRPLSYRKQSIDLLRKSIDWFLYDNGRRHEKVNLTCHNLLDELYRLIGAVKTNKDSDWRYFCVKEAWINAYSMKSC